MQTYLHKVDTKEEIKLKTKLKLITFTLLIAVAIIAIPQYSNAALQSNGQAGTTKSIDQWMLQIRQMESLGGGLGLSESINATGLKATTPSNNVDVHMQKNTEYGALIILSASSYGNPSKINDGQTTTGNSTGVVMKINKEWVSAGAGIINSTTWKNAVGRYKNTYTTSYVAKRGDAILNWHGSSSSDWIGTVYDFGLLRSYSGSVFSYYGYRFNGSDDPKYSKTWASRACLVQGEDF